MRRGRTEPAFWLMALTALCLTTTTVFAADRWALLIGVDRNEAIGNLKVCVNDARAMKAMLEKVGYDPKRIVLLTDDSNRPRDWPSIGNMRRWIKQLSKAAEKGDTFLLFFSGHGIMRGGEGYLVPTDGDRDNAIPLSWIRDQMKRSRASTKVLILDACHAGAAKGVDGVTVDLRAGANLAMLLSCQKGQVSWPDEKQRHSVFTRYLLEGLAGKAAGGDRKVTHNELFAYVRKRVKTWTVTNRKPLQEPVIGGDAVGDPVIAECPEEDVGPPIPPPGDAVPRGWTKETRRVKVATPQGDRWKEITYYTNTIGMKFVLIPAGEFLMGSRDSADEVARKGRHLPAWYEDEHPLHRVRITKPFYMGIYEVTQAQYERVMGKNPSRFKGPNNPVEQVSWNDAVEFCRRLSRKDGAAYRLPTEAEWEYACRAGTTTPFYTGETISTDQANYDGNYAYGSGRKGVYREKPLPVGGFPPNAFGLYDMHGNVWEWCGDWCGGKYYAESALDDPRGPAAGKYRVLRGGSWRGGPWDARSANRGGVTPGYRAANGGFRVVCVLR